MCDPFRISEKESCLVYSIGSNNNFMFEEAVLEEISPDCEIHTFDHTVGPAPSKKPTKVLFHPWALGKAAGPAGRSMPEIVRELGHSGKVIDILKIDCEGCEWTTYKEWFGEDVYIRQLQVELHKGTPQPAQQFFEFLQQLGYVVFHKEPNTLGCGGSCIEYAFLKLNPSFQQQPSALRPA